MQLLWAMLMGASIFAAVLAAYNAQSGPQRMATLQGVTEAQKYRVFTEAVQAYVAANPAWSGTLTWGTLGVAASTAEGARGAMMPASFKAVVSAGTFTVCGELSAEALTALVESLPGDQRGAKAVVPAVPNQPYQVLGPVGTDFVAEATKCL